MADLDFGKTTEESVMALKHYMSEIYPDYFGNGQTGWRDKVIDFIAGFRAVEIAREKIAEERHRDNTTRLNVIMALTGIAAFGLTAVGIAIAFQK